MINKRIINNKLLKITKFKLNLIKIQLVLSKFEKKNAIERMAHYNNDSHPDLPPSYDSIFNKSCPENDENFKKIIDKYGINQNFANRLKQLEKFNVVFIFDDSGSMNSQLTDSPLNTESCLATRWDELQYFAKIAFEILYQFVHEGLYFALHKF